MFKATIRDLKEVEREIQKRASLIPKVAAEEAEQIIIENSAAGVDIEGHRLAEYSPAYRDFKAKHGLPTSPSNMRFSGHLLDRQKVNVQGMKSTTRPSVTDTLIAEGNMKHRKFYPEVDTDFNSHLDRIVKVSEEAISE